MNEHTEDPEAPRDFLARHGPGLLGIVFLTVLAGAAYGFNVLTTPAGPGPIEQRPGFFSAFGFVAAVAAAIAARLMRIVLGSRPRNLGTHVDADDRP